MLLMPQTILGILSSGGSVRISAEGLTPQTMGQYAAAAAASGATVEFVVGDAMVIPQTMDAVSAYGRGHVKWDFVSKA
jgi:hypothetical protein